MPSEVERDESSGQSPLRAASSSGSIDRSRFWLDSESGTRSFLGRSQLLYRDLCNRPGGPWAWSEPDVLSKEKALNMQLIFEHCDAVTLARAEGATKVWRDIILATESSAMWQGAISSLLQADLVHDSSRIRIDSYKSALGMKVGQSLEQVTQLRAHVLNPTLTL